MAGASKQRVVILGAGTGGTLVANRLRHRMNPERVRIDVIDQNDAHLYQPGLLFVPFGMAAADDVVRSRSDHLVDGVYYHQRPIERVDVQTNTVTLTDGGMLDYDALVIASGSTLHPEYTTGLTGSGWMRDVFTFFDLPGATALAKRLEHFDRGRLVINLLDLPVKSPVAPIEFAILAHRWFEERGVRDQIRLTYATPLTMGDQPLGPPPLEEALADARVESVTAFHTREVDGERRRLISYEGQEIQFDLAVVVPVHGGEEYIGRSPALGDAFGYVPTDHRTLQSKIQPNVFCIGDAADLDHVRGGSVTAYEAEVLVENVVALLRAREPDASFDGSTNCFIEASLRTWGSEQDNDHHHGTLGTVADPAMKLEFQDAYWNSLLQPV
ncbi:MAG: FAD/NAD(P)-binding oxidoreductase [Actinomycetota bacterium]